MTNKRIKFIAISIVIVFIITTFLLIFLAVKNSKIADQKDATTQPTAPPYEGRPIVSIDDQTNHELYKAVGSEDYISIKYFLGSYLASKNIAKEPIPRISITNFKADVDYLGTIGSYRSTYSFDAYSGDLNATLQVIISDITNDDSPATITIINNGFSGILQDFRYDRN